MREEFENQELNQLPTVTEEESKILLVGAILKQVYDDLNMPQSKINSAFKAWKRLEKLRKTKKVNLNRLNNNRRYYEELINAKKDAESFVASDLNRIEDFLDFWQIDLNPEYIHKILTGPLPFKIK